ncbi:MAG: aspartate aminotransferase [Chloroflexi bacterium B3_Chlor]|nr:MAG: aspartate aminotransferase [Chloroflexi bacterium B3_Chlor]
MAILEREGSVVLQYHPAAGFYPLREWLAQRHDAAPEAVLVSNGSLQIEEFLTQLLTSPGDVVLVERPSYDRAITIFRRAGARVLGVPLESDGFDVGALENLAKREKPKFFYIIPDFQNPTGVTTSLAKRERLVELAERYDFWVLEDNPYRDLRYFGGELPTVFSLHSEKVLYLSSFSKVLSPGMRVGYLMGPEPLVQQLAKIAEDTYVSPNMIGQGVAYEYCRRGWLGPNIDRLREVYRPRLEGLASALEEYLAEARWTKPEGGFFIGVYLPPEMDTSLLRIRARDMGVVLSDGRGFFPESDGHLFLRLPFCALSVEEIREGIARIGSLANTMAIDISGRG